MGGAAKAIAGIANETSAQVRMFNSTNASANKPALVVTYTPVNSTGTYGTARGYYNSTGEVPNCLGYILWKQNSISPVFYLETTNNGIVSVSTCETLMRNWLSANYWNAMGLKGFSLYRTNQYWWLGA